MSEVPQLTETPEQRDARMQWFRDAKFGMFIHWGPCSVGEKEIGWGRNANRPWDINGVDGELIEDPEYDNYYKQFNPTKYNADEWVSFAKASGMKYMVLIAKHHDGFAQFDSKVSDYTIMASPYGKDIIKAYADACHRQGMKLGLYYSTRDWYHPDYLVGDNVKYDTFYRAQVEELLTHYGEVDVMWFDHVGGRDHGKWDFEELFEMMYRHHPKLIVNNRAAAFCGPKTPEDRGPASPEIEEMLKGDYYTPEGSIGSMDIAKDWESCIHVGQGWSYRGEGGFQGPDACIKMLVSCTTGGGNLLLNFGPRPDGTFADGEAKVAVAMGEWLKTYGEAIYGTRGGPYSNGDWGGSCHKGTKLFLHVYDWPEEGLEFDPLPVRVLSARTLTGAPVRFTQLDDSLSVDVDAADRVAPVTVMELELEKALEPGVVVGKARASRAERAWHGEVISKDASVKTSSSSEWDNPADHDRLFAVENGVGHYAFHTQDELNPWAVVDLGAMHTVNLLEIESCPNDQRSCGLIVSGSEDGEHWEEIWQGDLWKPLWKVRVTHFHAGINAPGRDLRFLKLETRGEIPRSLQLKRLTVFGE